MTLDMFREASFGDDVRVLAKGARRTAGKGTGDESICQSFAAVSPSIHQYE